ncbi:hypothetical protein [Rubripirellula tenax]|nr:hypothetical protein [Rubripirellula tenax]
MKQAIEDAKTKTQEIAQSTVEAVEEHLPPSGEITLRGATPIDPTSTATLELLPIGDGRPGFVQIASYDPTDSSKAYPAILLHGATTASSVSSLAGTTVACDVYLQVSSTTPIAMTAPGKLANVSFTALDPTDQTIKANIEAIELVGSDGKPVSISGGELVAVAKGGQ